MSTFAFETQVYFGDIGSVSLLYLVECLTTTSSAVEQCFYESVPVLFV